MTSGAALALTGVVGAGVLVLAVVAAKRSGLAAGAAAVLGDDALSEHFTLRELTVSSTAERLGVLNVPTPEVIENLRRGARDVLEPIRALNGGPIRVTSGYRAPAVQGALVAAIGASKTSDHPNGLAADIYDAAGANRHEVLASRIYDALRAGQAIPVDQVIVEYHTGHLHVGWGERWRAARFVAGGWLATHDGKTYQAYTPTSGLVA